MSTASDQSTSQGAALGNGIPPTIQGEFEDELPEEMEQMYSEEPGQNKTQLMTQIERDLDSLTYSGSTINELELQLTRTKELYKKTLIDCRQHVDGLGRKLSAHIKKSEPYIEIWRKRRLVQDASNKAAARYDKANNQYAAAKEMIRVAEAQLDVRQAEQESEQDPSSPSPIDLAWQEMLNHATLKVVATEKERRDSEVEHLRIMEQCTKVLEEYRATERKLRSHINKSRPYYQERYRANQRLTQIKLHIQALESKIQEAKNEYSSTLKRLETLNTEIHERRQSLAMSHLAPRRIYVTNSNPELRRVALGHHGATSDNESLDSLQLENVVHYTGSTGSLPSSIGTSSVSRSPTPDIRTNSPSPDGFDPLISGHHRNTSLVGGNKDDALISTHGESPLVISVTPPPNKRPPPTTQTSEPPTQTSEPPAQASEPPTQTSEPPTQTSEPPTQTSEPPTQTSEPPTQTSEPVAQTSEPPTQTSEPPTQTSEPPTQTSEPPTQTSEPPTQTSEPPVQTSEPVAQTSEPPTQTSEPPTQTSEPPTQAGEPLVSEPPAQSIESLASELVERTLAIAVSKLQEENSTEHETEHTP